MTAFNLDKICMSKLRKAHFYYLKIKIICLDYSTLMDRIEIIHGDIHIQNKILHIMKLKIQMPYFYP